LKLFWRNWIYQAINNDFESSTNGQLLFQFNNLQATQIDDLENALLPHLDGNGGDGGSKQSGLFRFHKKLTFGNMGLISPTFYVELLHAQIPKVQKIQ